MKKAFACTFAIVSGCEFLFRLFLIVHSGHYDFTDFIYSLALGFVFDFTVATYLFLPLLLWSFIPSNKLHAHFDRIAYYTYFFALITYIMLNTISEYFFFDELTDRFNFIAVDYLVYSNEVLHNIWESYPILRILSGVATAAAIMTWLLFRRVNLLTPFSRRQRWQFVSFYTIALVINITYINESELLKHATAMRELLSKNGIHAFFAAYRNNQINFDRFYTDMDSRAAAHIVHEALEDAFNEMIDETNDDEYSIEQNIKHKGTARELNVVLVLMESLSAKFMKSYGSTADLTPHLDELTNQSLFLHNIYATGTRTVRGIEAVMLSIPPTPGQSIVRRPGGQGIFNLGTVFRERGYQTEFVYGGHALFDNMGAFFEGNGFKVFDITDIPKNEITFKTAWGVCDEDLFQQVLKLNDQHTEKGEKFFQFILTTSNHRPFTYPDGRIDIPSGDGRSGAVKYSDYAIGKFIEQAKTKSWFKDTVFVFVSDHNAGIAGGTKVDPADYKIPIIFYSPANIEARRIDALGSQIDLGPTLLDTLHFSYQTKFFGQSMLASPLPRAFISTYQKIAYLTPQELILLLPKSRLQKFALPSLELIQDAEIFNLVPVKDEEIKPVDQAVAYYKAAFDWFNQHRLDEKYRMRRSMNVRVR